MKTNIKIFALFTFLTAVIFWPILLGKADLNGNLLVSFYAPWGENLPFKNVGWDQLRIYFPFYKVTLDAFRSFSWPLWNPYAFAGHPHAADFQTAVFYPLNIFGLFLSQIAFWHLLRVSPTILAAFFTFLYLKNLKLKKFGSGGLSVLASLFGALTFGFSPFILTWGEEVVMSVHSIIWLPLILFGIEKFKENGKRIFLAIISLGLAFSILGGYMQTTIYLCIFVGSYFLLRFGVGSIYSKRGLRVMGAFALGVLISAIQILPSVELFFRSARSNMALTHTLYDFLLPLPSAITFLVPDFFGHPATGNFFNAGSAHYYEGILFVGVAVLVFSLFAIFSERKNKLVNFLWLFALVWMLTTFDWFGSRLFLKLPIPFLSTSIPNRVLFIPAFSLAILGAMGFEIWLKSKDKKTLFRTLLIFFALYFVIGIWFYWVKASGTPFFDHGKFYTADNLRVSTRNFVVPFFVFCLVAVNVLLSFRWKNYKKAAAVFIIGVSFAQTFYFAQKYFAFSQKKYIFPESEVLSYIQKIQGNYRSMGVGEGVLETNFASQYGIYDASGYDSLNDKSYGEFTFEMQNNSSEVYVLRADAGFGRTGEAGELLGSANKRELLDLLGVKYLIAVRGDFPAVEKNNFKKVFESGNYGVFENLQVQPRAFLASNYEGPPQVYGIYGKRAEVVRRKLIVSKLLENFDWRNSLILEKPAKLSPQAGEGKAEIVSYKGQEVVIKTSSGQPKLLFVSDNYYPGWKVTVDGEEDEILRADYTFRAVALTPGEHTVRFYYDPWTFKLGVLITVLSLGTLALFTLRKNQLPG